MPVEIQIIIHIRIFIRLKVCIAQIKTPKTTEHISCLDIKSLSQHHSVFDVSFYILFSVHVKGGSGGTVVSYPFRYRRRNISPCLCIFAQHRKSAILKSKVRHQFSIIGKIYFITVIHIKNISVTAPATTVGCTVRIAICNTDTQLRSQFVSHIPFSASSHRTESSKRKVIQPAAILQSTITLSFRDRTGTIGDSNGRT